MDAIYLDNAATTPIDPRVVEDMLACMAPDADFANASSVSHEPGRRARARIENARSDVATLVGATPEQVVWTSGATEANNLAIFGAARFHRPKGAHVVTSRTEHPSVLDPCRRLEREGFEVSYLRPGPDGIVEPAQVEAALRGDTILVSLMHVNNETGVVQDVGEVGRICRSRGVLLHVDAAQGAGKLPLDVARDRIDLLAFTAHKMNGPKGMGALCVRREPRLGLVPLIYGGGQERGLRSGTLPTHQIAGFGTACRIASAEMTEEGARITRLRERLWSELKTLPGIWLNGSEHRRAPGILNVSIEGVEGESLLLGLSDLAVSSGSACATLRGEPSYVLRALGRSEQLAQGSLRISLGRFTTAADVERTGERIRTEVDRLRAIAPSHAAATG
jgi:cysteine desulfurase